MMAKSYKSHKSYNSYQNFQIGTNFFKTKQKN